MKRQSRRPLLVCLIGASVLSLAAFAATAQTASAVTLDTAAQSQAELDQSDPQTLRTVEREIHRNCLRYTGTRIVSRDKTGKRCVALNGRSYSREDIYGTGEVELSEALRKLDPSIR